MKMIVRSVFGSHLYGLDTPQSDMDYKGVFIPYLNDILLRKEQEVITTTTKSKAKLRNNSTDVDTEIFSVLKFMKLLLQGQAVSLDLFFTPEKHLLDTSPEWTLILKNKRHFLHKNISPYIGYCRQQAAKYGIKGSRVNTLKMVLDTLSQLNQNKFVIEEWDIFLELSKLEHCEIIFEDTRNMNDQYLFMCCSKKIQQHTKISKATELFSSIYENYGVRAKLAEKNEGIDWKALSHALRVADQGIELLKTHHITFPLENKEYLLEVKKGLIQFQEVSELIEQRFFELEEAKNGSTLPETPNHDKMNEIVLEIYKEHFFNPFNRQFI